METNRDPGGQVSGVFGHSHDAITAALFSMSSFASAPICARLEMRSSSSVADAFSELAIIPPLHSPTIPGIVPALQALAVQTHFDISMVEYRSPRSRNSRR